ncbi:MAG TPA: RagB/SusD family nutrient uptake outer membrane protein [Longimicrobiaceae bacterium]
MATTASGMGRIFNEWGVRNNPQEGFYLDIWTWLYQTINAANTIIQRAENPDIDWTERQKNEILAQARLFRAWAYRHLTYLWGDVPLNLEEASGESIRTDWERTPKAEVWAQMEDDLLFAEQYLPEIPSSPGRVSKAVARHYLAELYLAMDRPAEAEEKAAAVINGGNYTLITERYGAKASEPGVPFMDQFQDGNVNRDQGNTEALWVFQYQVDTPGGGQSIMRRYWVNRYYTIPGLQVSAEYGGRGIGRLGITSWALNLYEPQDDRGSDFAIRKFYLYNDPDRLPEGKELGDTVYLSWEQESETNEYWPSTRKWDWVDPQDIDGARQYQNQPYLRLAETYLLLAEAQMKQGKLAEAAENINIVRRRSNASEIGPDDVTLDFILDERSRELVTEEHRRYTLIRTGTLLERVKKYNPLAAPNIVERDTLFPIPQAVIDANVDTPMPQNPGY